MTKLREVYKCDVCGNIVEVVHTGAGELVCCGQPMVLQEVNTVDAAQDKHIPVIEKTEQGVKVRVGEVVHPMTEEHYIEWIELIVGDQVLRQTLKPGQVPEAVFCIGNQDAKLQARAYCNLHGLWRSEA